MINYSSVIEMLLSDKYVDKTDLFDKFFGRNYNTLSNCYGTGSSSFLKTLACFLDETANTKNLFRRLKIGQHGSFLQEVNAYRVLYLDFSDFRAENYEEAIIYVTNKMSQTFKHYWNILSDSNDSYYNYHMLERALDVIEQKPSESVLCDSLRLLILQLRGYETRKNGKKLAVLIDNMVTLETVAQEYGYAAQMETFLKKFIVDDVYKFCDIFLQISDIDEEDDIWFPAKRYLAFRNFSVFAVDIRRCYPELVVQEASQYNFHFMPFVPAEVNWQSIVDEGREKIRKEKKEEELARLEHIRKEREKYAVELSPSVPSFSPNLGLRVKRVDKSTNRYRTLNNFLRKLYNQCYPEFKKQQIYEHLQNFDWSRKIVKDVDRLKSDMKKLSDNSPHWEEVWVDASLGTWVQIVCKRIDDESHCSPASPENIKVYASMKNGKAEGVFLESLKFLMDNVRNGFAAKLSVYYRSDQICYWIAPDDFHCLEQFFMPYNDDMEVPMPFMAYLGKLGISKDFPGSDRSHNSMQADIIFDYFRSVNDIEQLDLEDMYNNYISKWNAIIEDDSLCGFKDCSALSFVVILDTLDAILGKRPINHNSFLMAGDGQFWRILADSRCWADVNTRLQKRRCNYLA